MTAFPAPRLSAYLSSNFSAGGNLNTEFFLGRLTWTTRRIRYFGGLALGKSAPHALNILVFQPALAGRLREGVGGIAIRARGVELSVAADLTNIDSLRRRTATVSLRFPLVRSDRKHFVP